MNVAALLHDSPSDDHRKRQENKEKEREKGQSSQSSPPLQPSQQQQQQPPPGTGDGYRSYSPLGGPGQQGQRQPVSPTNTFDARLREREMRERSVVGGRERERGDYEHPPYHPPTRPYSHSHSHPHPPPMATNLPPPPIPVGAAHASHQHVPRHQAYSHSPPAMHPSTSTPPFLSPLSTPRDAAPLAPPSSGGGPVPSAALPALGGSMAPAPEHSAEYGAQRDRGEESAHRRRAVRSLSSATAPLYHNNPRDRPPLAMRPRSPDPAGYRMGPGERPGAVGTTTTRSPVQPGPGFSVVPPSAQSPHQPRATPPGSGGGMGAMAPPPPSSSSSRSRGQHMPSPGLHPHGGVPGASTLSSPAMDSLRPHDNERRSGPPTPAIAAPPTPVATAMSASAAGALQPLAMRDNRDRDQRFERYPGEDPHQQPPPHHLHSHPMQQEQQQQQQRRVSRSSSMSGGMGPGASGLGPPQPYVMSPGVGGAGSPELAARQREEREIAQRQREREKWEIQRPRDRGMGGGPHHAHQPPPPASQQQQHRQLGLHHVSHPHHNHHPDHLQNIQYRERGLPPEKEQQQQPPLTTAPAPAARATSSRQGRREKEGGRGKDAGGGGGPPPETSGSSRNGTLLGSSGILTLAPPGVTVSKDPPPQSTISSGPPPGSGVMALPVPPGSRHRSPNPAAQAQHGQTHHQQYSSPPLQLGPVGGPAPDGQSSPEVVPYQRNNVEPQPFAKYDREQQKPPMSPPPEAVPYTYVDPETYPYPRSWNAHRDRRPNHGDGPHPGGELDGPSGSGGPGGPPRAGTPSRLAGPGAGVSHDAYHQAPFRHREHDRERDPYVEPHLLPAHAQRELYHPHRRPGPSPPPFSQRVGSGGRQPPPPHGQDRRIDRAPPPPHSIHPSYPTSMAPPSSAPLPHPHQQTGFPHPSHVHPRHYPPSSAPPGGLYPPQERHGHSPMVPGMESVALGIQILPTHMAVPFAPVSPSGDFSSSPLDPPMHIGTFVYPRLPFPYTFPTILPSTGSDSQEGLKVRKREFGDEMDDSSAQSMRPGRPRRERETHVTILIPNASLPTPPISPTSPISPSSSSSALGQSIRKPPTPRIWGGALPTDLYSQQYFSRVYGAQQSTALAGSSSSHAHGANVPGRREQQEPQLRRIYTDDSDVRLCALHAGCVSWTGVKRARRRGMDLRVKLALVRDIGRYIGGLPSESVVGAGPPGEPLDIGLSVEDDGVEEGEVEVIDERERAALMEGLRSADWMSGHDGCAFEVLGAEWVSKGTARSLGFRNRAQRLKEYGEQRAAILQDRTSSIGKRKRVMDVSPYPAIVTLPEAEKVLSRERTIIFGGWDQKGNESIGYKYDSETFKDVLFGPSSTETPRSNIAALNPVNESHPSTASKRRKLNGTAHIRAEGQDEDVEMDDAKSCEGTSTSMKSIVLENDREKFLLEVLPSSGSSSVDDAKGKGKEADKENLPTSISEDVAIAEKDAGQFLTRRFKLSILGSEREATSESRVLGANLGVEDVRLVEGGLAVSMGKDSDSKDSTRAEGRDEKESEGLFIRVERWRWAKGKEIPV